MAPRAKKDPDAPKSARSAYIYFVQDKLKETKASHPEMKQSDVMKEVGALWRGLSDAEKAPYAKLAATDKERASQEKAAYQAGQASPKKPTFKAAPKKPPAKAAQQEEEEEEEAEDEEEHEDEAAEEEGGDDEEEGEDETP